jgi:hypothetical protein
MTIVALVVRVCGMGCILLGCAVPFAVVRRLALDHAVVAAVGQCTLGLPSGLTARYRLKPVMAQED